MRVTGGGQEGVGFEAVNCIWWDGGEKMGVCRGGEGRCVGVLERSRVAEFGVGEDAQVWR